MTTILTMLEIVEVAEDAIRTLNQIGVVSSFVGGMGCWLQGNSRKPNVGSLNYKRLHLAYRLKHPFNLILGSRHLCLLEFMDF